MESEAPTTPPPTDGNDVSLEKEYLTLLFHFASLLHECASGRASCLYKLSSESCFTRLLP